MQQTREKKLSFSLAALTRWSSRVFLSVLDQTFFSLSNFLLSIALARWLPEVEFGAFALGFSIFLIFVNVPYSLIWQPMAVLGVSKSESDQYAYLNKLLLYQLVITVVSGLLICLLSVLMTGITSTAVLAAGLSLPCLALVWLGRQVCYFLTLPNQALKVSLTFFLLQMVGISGLHEIGHLSVGMAFAWTSFSSIVAFLLGWWLLNLPFYVELSLAHLYDRKLIQEVWSFGRWILFGTMAYSVSTLSIMPLLGIFDTLENIAAFKAMQNLVQPVYQGVGALSLIGLPVVSKRILTSSRLPSLRLLILCSLSLLTVGSAYGLVLLIWGNDFIRFIYQKEFYQDNIWLLYLLLTPMVLTAVAEVFRVLLRALTRSRAIFISQLFPAISLMIIGIPLIWRMGVYGAALTVIVNTMLESGALLFFVRKEYINRFDATTELVPGGEKIIQ